ncbi:MAG: flagellar hook-length control protein FliK [Pseudomonadota bacterium]
MVDPKLQESSQQIAEKVIQQPQGLKNSLLQPQVKNLPKNEGKIKLESLGQMEPSLGEDLAPEIKTRLTQQAQSQDGDSQPSMNKEVDYNQFFEMYQSASVEWKESQFGVELDSKIGGQSSKIDNMNSVIKQAKAFVDDGGGRMEIHLQPEGLGKVHLKVAVNDGQVNVEMKTDNPMAKKALEENLADMKTALEGQKLLVETMKVEMSQDYQRDFSDLNNHFQEQANRDFAEQFLGQFRQEREQRLGGMFDAFRNFQQTPGEPELQLNRANPYGEQGKGRTVNLVA